MSPLIQEWQVLAFLLALVITLPTVWLADVALRTLQRYLARRRSVLGRRVPLPEWRARRLTTGRWIVERRR
ncbi:MAG: hypothetical protein RI988_2800 [Pseudomonadota bacterium]|jgi:hypothetical protein